MSLIIKAVKDGDTISMRLINGETLLAKLVSQSATEIKITKPVVANPVQQEGRYGIFYTPFCATVDEDDTHVIPMTAVLIKPVAPRAELVSAYLKMTTGLDIPG